MDTIYFKRNEPFRFTFEQPIPGKLYDTNDDDLSPINVSVLDVSNFGAKVYCEDKIRLERDTQVKLSFKINDVSFDAIGSITWTKPAKTSYEIGLHLDTDETYHHTIIESLKKLRRMNNT